MSAYRRRQPPGAQAIRQLDYNREERRMQMELIPGYDDWKTTPPDDAADQTGEKLRGPGYEEIGSGVFVPKEDALGYAIERIAQGTKEESQEFVDWFYSGDWIKEAP